MYYVKVTRTHFAQPSTLLAVLSKETKSTKIISNVFTCSGPSPALRAVDVPLHEFRVVNKISKKNLQGMFPLPNPVGACFPTLTLQVSEGDLCQL